MPPLFGFGCAIVQRDGVAIFTGTPSKLSSACGHFCRAGCYSILIIVQKFIKMTIEDNQEELDIFGYHGARWTATMAEADNHQSEDASMRDASPSVKNDVEEIDVDHEENQDGKPRLRLFKLSSLAKKIGTHNFRWSFRW